jgi:hypothetical protein
MKAFLRFANLYPTVGKTHELRNEITPSKQTIVGTKEYLSSVKAKKV